MSQQSGVRILILLFLLTLNACSNNSTKSGSILEERFTNPSDESKPWVYWYWMHANATKEGITNDLESMADIGIGGAYLMPVGNSSRLSADEQLVLVDPPADPLSDHWWGLVVHAVKEADRLGLQLAMNACDGWALAGGPWITPEMSMQEIVSTKTIIYGGETFVGKLAQPETKFNYYRDIAILAYPLAEGTNITSTVLKPKATTNIAGLDPQILVKGAEDPVSFSEEGWIQYEFEEPFTCRSIKISPDQRYYQLHRVKLSVSDDGENFRSLGRLKPTQYHGWQDRGIDCTHSVEEVKARFFRFEFDKSGTPDMSENKEGTKIRNRNRLGARHIELNSQPFIHQWEGKAGYRWRRSEWTTDKECTSDLCVPVKNILNITDKMDSDGTLKWSPPQGRWIVHRIGYTTTGETNNPAGTGSGLECDKFNKKAAVIQFDGWFGQALKRVGPELAGKTLVRNHTDSWEAFSQNWSPVFREEFIKRRGYDPVPWLPAMSGIPVESASHSERFLYDIRRTIADLVSENFYSPFVKSGQDFGATFSAECIAPTMMSDGLQHFKYVDMPMGEFWLNSVNQDKPNDVQDAISGGHTYGKKIIGAEAFTQNPISWDVDPYYLKPMGDYNFARGINQFVLHVWAHQAFDKEPGVTLNRVGTFFSGTQTWHKPGKAFIQYLHRCSEMLRKGLPVIDVCYFIGEELPARSYLRNDLPIPLPEGYSYDCINRDALLTGAKAEQGRMVLPDGMSYRLLVLPSETRMTPELAQKIGELADAGIPVIGKRPQYSYSLTDYPACDEKVRKIVRELWGSVRESKGLKSLRQPLDELGIIPDVEIFGVDMTPVHREKMEYFSPPVVWNHRKTEKADIYYISNQERKSQNIKVAFRIKDRIPELWDPETGKITDAGIWRREKNRTLVNLNMTPAGAVFVVFRRKSDIDSVIKISSSDIEGNDPQFFYDGALWSSENGSWLLRHNSGETEQVYLSEIRPAKEIEGSWSVSFHSGPDFALSGKIFIDSLQSLGEHDDDMVRYFSGTAAYKIKFEVKEIRENERLFLDLGKVANLAEVSVNGNNPEVLWKPPYVVEVTEFIKEGMNELSVAVTNTWHNRLVGDAGLPPEERTTWLLFENARPDPGEGLKPAGLIGPVTLRKFGKATEKE